MKISFEYATQLQYENKALRERIRLLESGEAYLRLRKEYERLLEEKEREIRQLKAELEDSRRQSARNRENWFPVYEDMEKEKKKEIRAKTAEIRRLRKMFREAVGSRDQWKEKYLEQLRLRYETETALEEEKGKNLKLRAQLNRDYENSSLPSSKTVHHKKITNSREKSGKKPGGQPGHKGHCRKRQTPTVPPVLLPAPGEVPGDPDFKKTKRTIVKQMVNIRLVLDVREYHADVYRNSKTGELAHAQFPAGVINDVNYGGSVRAFLFLLNNECCTSIDKSRKFLRDLTGGKLDISKGMVSSLCQEFAVKTEQERKKLFAEMLLSPVIHTDCTNAKVNGKSAYVFVCATPDGKALYFARDRKWHEGVKGTVTEDYQGILVHDHERTFYQYGTGHQECLAHVLRCLKDSIQNEPDRTWNNEMRTLIQEMIHYRNGLLPEDDPDAEKTAGFEERYREILHKAEDEYKDVPPNEYYKEGYNLYRRMEKYMENHLLFLHDYRVPATNNEAERLLRSYKRKQQQAVSFRSQESIYSLCKCMSMLVMMRQKEEQNLFERISQIFG